MSVMAEWKIGKTSYGSTERFSFVWDFKKFPTDLYPFGSKVRSPEFNINPFSSSKQCFEFYPRGKTTEQRDKYAGLYLVQSKGEEKVRNIRFSCNLVKPGRVDRKDKSRSLPSLIPKANASWVHPINAFLVSNFSFEIDVSFEKDPDQDVSVDENLQELSDDLRKAYDENLFWDMCVAVEGGQYKLHKPVIEARFPQIRNVNFLQRRDFEQLLVYLYSGKLDRTNIAMEFYDLLSRYKNCKMQPALFANPSKMRAETCFSAKTVSFIWKIKKINSLKPGETLTHFFFADESEPWTWFQAFFKIVEPSAVDIDKANIMVSLQRYSEKCKCIACCINVAQTKKIFRHVFDSANVWNIPSFVPKETFLQLANDEIILDFEVTVFDGTCTTDVNKTWYHPSDFSQFSTSLKQLQTDLRKLLLDSKVSDLRLVVDSEVLPVHRFILGARSLVFRKMIEKNMASGGDPKMTTKNLDASVLKSMLRYMYCAEIDKASFKHVVKVYSAAIKYKIPGLKRVCASNLKSCLTPDNAVQVLLLADDYSETELKKYAMHFICSNSVSVINCSQWGEIKQRENLTKELLEISLKHIAGNK